MLKKKKERNRSDEFKEKNAKEKRQSKVILINIIYTNAKTSVTGETRC